VLQSNETHTINAGGIFLMNELFFNFLKDDVAVGNELDLAVEDEFDEFDRSIGQLLHVESPVNMVARIMQAVSALPQPRPLSQWSGYDFMMLETSVDQLS
jgi:hypothetical protein